MAGEDWTGPELVALIEAARALVRSAALVGVLRDRDDPLRVVADGRLVWAVGEALSAPRERAERALGEAGGLVVVGGPEGVAA